MQRVACATVTVTVEPVRPQQRRAKYRATAPRRRPREPACLTVYWKWYTSCFALPTLRMNLRMRKVECGRSSASVTLTFPYFSVGCSRDGQYLERGPQVSSRVGPLEPGCAGPVLAGTAPRRACRGAAGGSANKSSEPQPKRRTRPTKGGPGRRARVNPAGKPALPPSSHRATGAGMCRS